MQASEVLRLLPRGEHAAFHARSAMGRSGSWSRAIHLRDTIVAVASITLRPATIEDVPTLESWDRDPAVIACTTDDPNADQAFGDHDVSPARPPSST